MTPSRLDEIAARLAKATRNMNPCEITVDSPDLAYLLARLKKAEAVCEIAEEFTDGTHLHERRGTGHICNWCGQGWPCSVSELRQALITWQEARG